MGEHQENFDYTDLRRCAGFFCLQFLISLMPLICYHCAVIGTITN